MSEEPKIPDTMFATYADGTKVCTLGCVPCWCCLGQAIAVPPDLLARLASNSWYLWDEWEQQPLKKIGVERIYQDWQAARGIIEQWEKTQEPWEKKERT